MDIKVLTDYKGLEAWQKAFALAAEIYRSTKLFPQSEIYGLSSQLRRSAVSVVSNIAEGASRHTTRDFVNFLHIARGSLAELETQVLLTREIGLMPQEALLVQRINEVGRLLNGLIRSLNNKIAYKAQR